MTGMSLKFVYQKMLLFAVTISAIRSVAQVPNSLHAADKIYGLSKFWSEVNTNFAYFDKLDKHVWDSTYQALLDEVPATKNDYAYYRLLQKFCALLQDGHTHVFFPDTIDNQLTRYDFGQYRLFVDDIDNRAIIRNVNANKKAEIPVGSEIMDVNGLPVKTYIEKYVKPFISESTPKTREVVSIQSLFLGFPGDSYEVKIRKPDGKEMKLQLTHATPVDWTFYPAIVEKPVFEFRWMNTGIAYIALNTFNDAKVYDDFISKLPEISRAKSLIIDLRTNGGGSGAIAKKIAQYFISGNLLYNEKVESRQLISVDKGIGSFLTAADTIQGKTEWGLTKQETTDYYNAYIGNYYHTYESKPDTLDAVKKLSMPTVLLTSYATGSAAEDFLIYTDGQKQIIRIGGYSNGSTGQPLQLSLPGGGSAWICTKKCFYPDGRAFVGIGVKPDIEVRRTLTDYRNDADTELNRAIEYLKHK